MANECDINLSVNRLPLESRPSEEYLLFVIPVKSGIQMFDYVRDSHLRGNDNPVIITFYTGSIPSGQTCVNKEKSKS